MNIDERVHRLAAFPRTNPNPVLEFDSSGLMTYCNDAARRLASSLGADSPALILPADAREIIRECLRTGGHKEDLQTNVQRRTLSWSFIPVSESNVVHCYAADITERLNLESQLRHSVKMEAVGQLAAGVAHDFNNILTIIQGHAALLEHSAGLAPKQETSLRQIILAAERAAQLISQLLMFSRKQIMQQRHTNINDVISNVAPMLSGLTGEHIAVQYELMKNLPAVSLDVGMIEQVLVNLVLNARDAMPRGGRMTISTSTQTLEPVSSIVNPDARPGNFVCLTVADTGSGMGSEIMTHLFEPFFTTKEPGKGTGLGLATVYGIVKQHRGWINVDSRPGVGTTFSIFLPGVAQPAEPMAQTRPATGAAELAMGDETLLVVEDEPALRDLVVNILQLCGYRIYSASSGVDALGVWEKHKDEIKLVLTDMVMPQGMSGRQLAERLQAEKPSLKVIYTSGYSPGMAGKDIALLEGFNFLAKPYPPGRLANVVRECLDGRLT